MTFNSLQYALFLPVVVGGYWLLPRRPRGVRQGWLLAASYLFYGLFDVRFLALLLFTTTVDFLVGLGLERYEVASTRRRVLSVSIAVNLGVLGYFKYAGFFVDQAVALLGRAGLDAGAPVLRVALPYGISFYTFQSIGYTVDVHRRQIRACRNPLDFATFVAFFPQLVAGPISRARNLLPQITADRPRPGADRVLSGLLLMLLGLVKKVVIADPLAPLVDRAFGGAGQAGTVLALAGILAFAVQIYADFSAYTDLARGTARLLGIELVHNFDQPYLSRSITEFWRRWHISLSTWLRDYLYVPLGGNRGSTARTYRNLLLTMLLGGLWHGAGWGFVVWGGLHGLYLVVERATGRTRGVEGGGVPRWADVPAILGTFALVCVAWVFFRARSLDQAVAVFGAVLRPGGTAAPAGELVLLAVAVAAVLTIDLVQRGVADPFRWLLAHPARTGVLVGAAAVAVVLFSGGASVPFIYFQF